MSRIIKLYITFNLISATAGERVINILKIRRKNEAITPMETYNLENI